MHTVSCALNCPSNTHFIWPCVPKNQEKARLHVILLALHCEAEIIIDVWRSATITVNYPLLNFSKLFPNLFPNLSTLFAFLKYEAYLVKIKNEIFRFKLCFTQNFTNYKLEETKRWTTLQQIQKPNKANAVFNNVVCEVSSTTARTLIICNLSRLITCLKGAKSWK